MGIATRSFDPIWRRFNNLNDIATIKGLTRAGNFNNYAFTWNSMANKEDRAFMSGNEMAAVSHFFNGSCELFAHFKRPLFNFSALSFHNC
jgi:hypothetical protein